MILVVGLNNISLNAHDAHAAIALLQQLVFVNFALLCISLPGLLDSTRGAAKQATYCVAVGREWHVV